MSNNSFLSESRDRFELQMNSMQWRKDTFEQLSKDFHLCGVSLGGVTDEFLMDDILHSVAHSVQSVKSTKQQWDNLNYRIDVPTNVDVDSLSIAEVSRLFLFRCFQKVWIRKQYSTSQSKDASNDMQEHLKP